MSDARSTSALAGASPLTPSTTPTTGADVVLRSLEALGARVAFGLPGGASLPLYDAIARMKTHGHWQSDVLVGAAIGTGFGIYAARRDAPIVVGWLPGGISVGFRKDFE